QPFHGASQGPAGCGSCDPAETGEPQDTAGTIAPQQELWLPAVEVTVPDKPVGLYHAPRGSQDEQHGDVRRRIGEAARGVAHHDASTRRSANVDGVEADSVVGHAPD